MGKGLKAFGWIMGLSLAAIVGAASSYDEDKRHSLHQKLEYQSFCRTALDIASSNIHYQIRLAQNEQEKSKLLEDSDQLLAEKNKLDLAIQETKKQLLELFNTDEEKESIRAIEEKGDLRAVSEAGSVSNAELIQHVNDACLTYFTK